MVPKERYQPTEIDCISLCQDESWRRTPTYDWNKYLVRSERLDRSHSSVFADLSAHWVQSTFATTSSDRQIRVCVLSKGESHPTFFFRYPRMNASQRTWRHSSTASLYLHGQSLVSASNDESARIWNIRDGSSKVTAVTGRPDTFGMDGTSHAKFWDNLPWSLMDDDNGSMLGVKQNGQIVGYECTLGLTREWEWEW